jgi:hypothetical protein
MVWKLLKFHQSTSTGIIVKRTNLWIKIKNEKKTNKNNRENFRSEERNQALRLCGWPYDPESSILGPLLEKLQADGQVSRAAALAVFHMKIRKAIKILTRSGIQKNQVSYQLVALALAGKLS